MPHCVKPGNTGTASPPRPRLKPLALELLYFIFIFPLLCIIYAVHMKRFIKWMQLKERIDVRETFYRSLGEGDIWWCLLGENVGSEINGKGDEFIRPVVILKKFSRTTILVVPLTSNERVGSWFVPFSYRGRKENAVLNQIRIISVKRLTYRMGKISSLEYDRIITGLKGIL